MLTRITSFFSALTFQSLPEVEIKAPEQIQPLSAVSSSSHPSKQEVESKQEIEGKAKPPAQEQNRIILMLDESGSMKSQRSTAVDAVNSFISKQKEGNPGDICLFDLITFNDVWKRIVSNTRIEDVKKIEIENYAPNGGTALYDSIWDVINKHATESEVMLVVMTDGQDTSSSHHTQEEVKERLTSLNKEKDWQVVWLGADVTVMQEGINSGASAASSVSFNQLPQYLSSTLSEGVSAYRKNKNMKIKL
jgi:Mg-chelatase subunit ChlD